MNEPKAAFISPSFIAMFAGAFFLVVVFAIILQQIGAPTLIINLWMLCFCLGTYIFSGLYAKTMQFSTFQFGDQRISPVYSGMAITAALLSGNMILLLPGNLYFGSPEFAAYFSGSLLGVATLTLLYAASIARAKTSTLAGLLFPQNASKVLLCLTALIVIGCCFSLIFAQFKLLGYFTNSFFRLDSYTSILVILSIITFCLVMGGMKSLKVSRVLAFSGIVIAFFTPLIWISYKISGNPFPQLSFGSGALQPVLEIDQELIGAGFATARELPNPLTQYGSAGFLDVSFTMLAMAGGIASLPHLLQHFVAFEKGRLARNTGFWVFCLTAVILTAIPSVAIFAKYNLYTSILGLQIADLELEAPWLFAASGASGLPLITICGELVSAARDIAAACGQPEGGFLSVQEIGINPDYLLLGSGVISEIPSLLTIMFVLAVLFCVASTVDGTLLVMANTTTADLYGGVFRPKSPPGIKLFMNRFFIVMFAGLAALFYPGITISSTALFSISLIVGCATLFPLLTARLWLPKLSDMDVGIGLAGGLLVALALITITTFGADWVADSGDEYTLILPGIETNGPPVSIGLIGFVTFWILTTLTNRVRAQLRVMQARRDVDATI